MPKGVLFLFETILIIDRRKTKKKANKIITIRNLMSENRQFSLVVGSLITVGLR